MSGFSTCFVRAGLGLVLALAVVVPSTGRAAAAEGVPGVYVIDGHPHTLTVIKYDDRGVTFIKDLGDGVECEIVVQWNQLSAKGRKIIRGESGSGGGGGAIKDLLEQGGGELIPATRFTFKNGRVYVGLEIPHRSTPTEIAIRTKYAPELRLPRDEVKNREPIMLPETEFYSLEEIYQRCKAELAPGDNGRRHYQLAQEMVRIRYWEKAREHFERAMILDERFTESAKRKIAEMEAADTDDKVRHLDQLIAADIRNERWMQALQRIKTLALLDPDNPIRTKWESQLSQIMEKIRATLRRSVVNAYYRQMEYLIRIWAQGKIPDGGVIPGVRVTMKTGEALEGKLISDDEEFIVLDNNNRTLRIAKDMVAHVTNINMNKRMKEPGFAESKKHVEDTSGGLTAAIVSALVEKFKDFGTEAEPVDGDRIAKIWEDRFTTVVEITRHGRVQVLPVSSIYEANYGVGTWLREGMQSAGGSKKSSRRGSKDASKRIETDPEKWWKKAPREVRYQVLRAIAAEALCEVDRVVAIPCQNCGGQGSTKQITGGGAGGGGTGATSRMCLVCRGLGHFVKIRYK